MFNPNSILRILKSQLQNPKFYSPTSHFHNRSSKNPPINNPAIQFILNEAEEFHSSKNQFAFPDQKKRDDFSPQKQHRDLSSTHISHPWREWVDLMERLLKDGYFDEIGNPFANNGELGSKEANLIRTASLNFSRDHSQLIRQLSRKDIMVIAGSGCPSTDRKVVNSGKRLRAHVGIDEGNVCSSCILRGDCDRAYVKARVDEGGRTVDVMRFLLMYGLDPVIGCVENKPCLNKSVKESVRTLLKQIVGIRVDEHDSEPPKVKTRELTQENDIDQERSQIDVPMKQGDWICPKCKFLNFARNVKCLRCNVFFEERLKKLAEEQENLPLKKGDWFCDKCKFLNFARNTRCLQCKEKPPKRQLNPGEWECDSCNYVNFRRNMVCLKCDHKRPIASQHVYDTVQNHHTQTWFGQEKQSSYMSGYDDSLKFVESESRDDISSSSRNNWPDFLDFPVIGGKSGLCQNVQNQESQKIEITEKSRNLDRDNFVFRGTSKSLASDDDDDDDNDDDDDMAEWFKGRKKLM